MGLWNRLFSRTPDLADVLARLERAENALVDLRRADSMLAQEWTSVLDKIGRATARDAARRRRDVERDLEEAAAAALPPEPGLLRPPGPPPGTMSKAELRAALANGTLRKIGA